MNDTNSPKPVKEPFENIVSKIEGIVRELESNDIPLDEALEKFEEGVRLSRAGSARLEEAERRIEEILSDGTRQPLSPLPSHHFE